MATRFKIHGDFDFLGSLYDQFDSLNTLFMKDLGGTVGSSRVFQFVVLSSIGETPIRSLKQADRLYIFWMNYIAISERYLNRRMTGEEINDKQTGISRNVIRTRRI
jgi:hypothetical protein